MKVANCLLKLNEGHSIPMTRITPAEAQVLRYMHEKNVGSCPIINVEETGEIDWTEDQEVKRLRRKYPKSIVKALFPGSNPRLPTVYADALTVDLEDIEDEGDTQHEYDRLCKEVAKELNKPLHPVNA